MDGRQFFFAVRRRHGPVPFVLYTGERVEALVEEVATWRPSGYVEKGVGPAQYETLARQIIDAVEGRRDRGTAARPTDRAADRRGRIADDDD
jgi:DNA-binding NarL/FixJ family response regulator